ncbi:SIS domain-containing protein [Falsiroseomonas oryzae]|uniref:SIS domain-containing protein n=1 Tax=Falsiroseomonas oryzae TaxID=2766473 RepID=UPI0022EB088A|nr:SIS domain-containing protein [Roseomonas sp. MO-31]
MSAAAEETRPPSAPAVIERIRAALPGLSRSYQALARLVLDRPETVTRMSLAAFADAAQVSQPTVIRFCRHVGCDGFPDFKISLAQAMMIGLPYVHSEIGEGDDLPGMADKIFGSAIATLRGIREGLDLRTVARAVEAIAAARRIELFGTGLSGVAAMDANQKFMRLGVPTVLHLDSHLQRMAAVTLTPADVAIGFSYTGQIRDMVRTATLARERGATVIAVTRPRTAFARVAHIVIAVDTPEDTFVYAPMTTRLAHLAVVDLLSTAVAVRAGPGGVATIQRVKTAVRDQWLSPDETADEMQG